MLKPFAALPGEGVGANEQVYPSLQAFRRVRARRGPPADDICRPTASYREGTESDQSVENRGVD